ncbi:MAG: 50S ribosomal protein L13 [Candidatus Yanofskybacteria bacterium GW2011_GWA1_44_21]|uniref:Large ribosomal subunit protein uL13 n=2 Tax=Candidatus Yanofskyibacteriota TaxID=1752733 RepID=A0A1F8GZL6_9BACT|nr:MAG: 50S ribosomal protein L13 [Candidatus Yanofskybacteria bacterium GW2011_GWA1_44_21]KKT90284.1 MAG: 50S ribosomal protein L13 [Candidatus Yanofskybacteria bacterium GW2011_GWB1_45_11]OGN03061.1 MAG: 50S ribosomal protein L13 [Candidatus Yanofskybacteria bacterium RIFCSPHIGHO2_01_FULL_44_110b]OGN14559.1 MAG: 50S ribosomal protein L13 [Candidatus Yanofskybacteria bacterium RIFCSPHIGHO2_02_FULL_44_36b]OGN18232.1 MAG: 50S ribosomal protein L13 [Candidatus Yanofskybacteria bacterium RIFCSPHIG
MEIIIDATNQTLGRLATKIATTLRGKHLASFEPNQMPGIIVKITNYDKIRFTGQKLRQKEYYHYSGYHSGLKTRKLGELWISRPTEVIRMSVYRMLPKNKMRDKLIKNLKFA